VLEKKKNKTNVMEISEINQNGIELSIHNYVNDNRTKKYIDVYTSNPKNKMFIYHSIKSGKNLRISLHIDGNIIQLSEKYDYNTSLDVFTNLVNKISNK
jgi:hypothetical protein